ncbi:long-chain acyl-CoA synthetase [Lachnospiraceae bacterium XBB2008]|nr:long-chain acyl-CoA synthetase [Lachnospiraceae bacterium XBB2008]
MESIVQILYDHAVKSPDQFFASDDKGNKFTYVDAWHKVKEIAFTMSNNFGIGEDDCVVVECNQQVSFLLIDLACELVGGVFVPIEKDTSCDRKDEIVDETDAKIFVYYTEKTDFPGCVSYDELLEETSDNLEDPVLFPSGERIAEILYSTGTTGKSKGIVISNSANVALAENIRYGVNMRNGNVEFLPVPISHSHGLRCFYANVLNGGAVVLSDGLMRVKQALDLIKEYHVTAMDLSPNAVMLLIKLGRDAFWECAKTLDYIQIGTAVLPESLKEELLEKLPGVHLYNFYGSTESGRSCVLDFSMEKDKKNCIGLPTKNSEIIFADSEGKAFMADSEHLGTLATKGTMNMLCYWRNPELSGLVMRNGYVYSSDLGYKDEDGYVYVLGRKDDVIICNGINISPDEIEAVAVQYDGITDAACVPVSDELKGQAPKLFIVLKNAEGFDKKLFVEFLSFHLELNKMPKYIVTIDKIPRTANGKIQRKRLM